MTTAGWIKRRRELPDDDPAPAGICPRCHLALPLSGECDC